MTNNDSRLKLAYQCNYTTYIYRRKGYFNIDKYLSF